MSYNAGDHRALASSQSAEVFPFVEASTARAPRQRLLRGIGELKRAKLAPDAVPQREPLAPLTSPPEPTPERENEAQEEEQINKDEISEADPDHGTSGVEEAAEGESAKASAPQVKVANPHTTSGTPSLRENSC